MSIINFPSKNKTKTKSVAIDKKINTDKDVIDFTKAEKIPEFEPVTEEPVIGYIYPMGQFMVTNIPNIGCFATLINKEQQ